MIQKGAYLVMEPNEILQKYTGRYVKQLSIDDIEKLNNQKSLDIKKVKKEYQKIYKALSESLSVNELSEKTSISISNLYQKLFLMEMEGLIIFKENKYSIIRR